MSRAMKDSGVAWIGEIPEGWKTVRFKFLHNGMNTGEGIDKEYWSTDDQDTLFYTAGLEPIRTNYGDFPKWKYTKATDLLLARNGTPYVYLPDEGACYTDHIIRASLKEKTIREFIRYSLQQSIASVVVDSVSLATWSASLWDEQAIAWPPLPEQSRIAAFLDRRCTEIDRVIAATQRTIEEYKKLKQSIITEAVTHGVRGQRKMKESGVEWLGMIPENWSVYRIANVYDERNESGSDDLPILLVSINTGISDHEVSDDEQTRSFVRIEDRTKYKRVYPGDLAYNMMRAWQGAFGAARVDGMVSPAYVVAKPRGNALIDSRYMEALLRSPSAIDEMHRFSHGITDFRLRLYWPEFKSIRICIPPYDEQVEIADYVDQKSAEIDRLIEAKQQLLTQLEAYKKSVIYEYVTGKKEVV